jgi:hypothetical protein
VKRLQAFYGVSPCRRFIIGGRGSVEIVSEPVVSGPQVGSFAQGNAFSQWALARYLVGRAIAESLGRSLLVIGLAILALAAGLWWGVDAHGWGVLVAILGFVVLLLRALVMAIIRRLTATREYAPVEQRLRSLVADTRKGVLRELRRVGLPGRIWTLPLLAVRLLRPSRRRDTLQRMRQFEVSRVVPQRTVDELHMLIRSAVGR